MKITIFDGETNEQITRDMTAEEVAEREAEVAGYVARKQAEAKAEADAEAKRFAALAKLEALGLNEDDLKALGL